MQSAKSKGLPKQQGAPRPALSLGQAPQGKPMRFPLWRLSRKQLLGLLAAALVFYFVYGILLPPVATVTNTKSFTLALNQTLFLRVYNGTTTALKLHAVTPTGAVFYITKLPVLYNPLITLNLSALGSANVSSYGSQVADMNIQLLSNGVSSAKLQITPLQGVYAIRPSPGLTVQNPAGIGVVQNASSATSLITTSMTSTTTSSTTTVYNSTATLFQRALTLLNQAGLGTLMTNYNKLYIKDTACNQSVYNSTYQVYYHKLPPAPVSFVNVSSQTPTKINITESTLPQPSSVKVTYSTVAPSPGSSGPAVIAIVNTSSPSFLTNTLFTGIYLGLNSMVLNSSYAFQSRILNNCGAYISPTS